MTTNRREGLFGPLLLEGVVIVMSILFAFALDTWWDGQRERTEEIAVLQNLRQEFMATGEEFEVYYGWHQRITASVGLTLEAARKAMESGAAHISIPDTVLALVYLAPTFDPELGTLDGLLSSGHLGLIRDPQLRRSLAGWRGLLRDATEEEVRGQRYVVDQLDPVFRTRMDVSGPLAILLAFVDDSLTAEQEARVSVLPVDTEVLGVLAMRHVVEEHGLEDLEDVRKEIDRILELIEVQSPG
jgi:hypothetical protein